VVTICTIICNNRDLLILQHCVSFFYKSQNKYFHFSKHDLHDNLYNGYRWCSLWSTNWNFTYYIYTTIRPQAVYRRIHKIVRATISWIMSVRPSVLMEFFSSHWKDFHKIWYLRILCKSVEQIQISLKSEKNNGYLILRRMCSNTFIITSRLILRRVREVSDKPCRNKQTNKQIDISWLTLFFYRKSCPVRDNMEKVC